MSEPRVTLGLRANWQQFTLLVLVNAFVGAMVGQERTIVPLIADQDFGLASSAVILSFIISFGIVKALANLLAGRFSDRMGRKRILVAGWLAGLPVPFLLIFAPGWGWVVLANVLLGINQGLCWSTTVIMKIDLVGPEQRGLAMGLNEFAGYISVSLAAFLTGYLASGYGLRPVPFYPGIAFAVMGLALSFFFVRETRGHAQDESDLRAGSSDLPQTRTPSFAQILLLTSWRDGALFAASQAGMFNNLNDGLVWGLIPIYLTSAGLPLAQVAVITATYPGVWGVSQLVTGALSDHWGRKWLIAAGMWVQAAGIGLFWRMGFCHGSAARCCWVLARRLSTPRFLPQSAMSPIRTGAPALWVYIASGGTAAMRWARSPPVSWRMPGAFRPRLRPSRL